MTGTQLINAVKGLVKDASFDSEVILDLLNEGLIRVTRKVKLPDLDVTADVSTTLNQPFSDLPQDYQHGLYSCLEENRNNIVKVLQSKGQLLGAYGRLDNSGTSRHVCRYGAKLLYQPVPVESRKLTISYYRFPIELEGDDEPEGIPKDKHRVLVAYVAFRCFEVVESGGVDNKTPNTNKYRAEYKRLLEELDGETDNKSHPPPPIVRSSF